MKEVLIHLLILLVDDLRVSGSEVGSNIYDEPLDAYNGLQQGGELGNLNVVPQEAIDRLQQATREQGLGFGNEINPLGEPPQGNDYTAQGSIPRPRQPPPPREEPPQDAVEQARERELQRQQQMRQRLQQKRQSNPLSQEQRSELSREREQFFTPPQTETQRQQLAREQQQTSGEGGATVESGQEQQAEEPGPPIRIGGDIPKLDSGDEDTGNTLLESAVGGREFFMGKDGGFSTNQRGTSRPSESVLPTRDRIRLVEAGINTNSEFFTKKAKNKLRDLKSKQSKK